MKLIILNGPSGVGKSTISVLLRQKIQDSVIIDVDELRRSVPDYKERREESLRLSYEMTRDLIDSFLKEGKDVIIDKAISYADTLESLVTIGRENNAEVFELLIFADKETVQQRADNRGYKPGSLLTREKVGELWDKANSLRIKRPNTVVIDTKDKSVEESHREILEVLGCSI